MKIMKYTACYSVFAIDENEAWKSIDEIVDYSISNESTISNTFGLIEEEPTKEEIEVFKLEKLMNDFES